MARLVAAFGASHSPALASPPEDMAGHARRDEMYAHHLDRDGNRVTFEELIRRAPAVDISPETIAERAAACERHIDRLARSIEQAKLDALVIVGDDQHEQYFEENMPAFLVYCGETIPNSVLQLAPEAPEYWKRARSQYHEPDKPREYPVASRLALHVVDELIENEFDIACGAAFGLETHYAPRSTVFLRNKESESSRRADLAISRSTRRSTARCSRRAATATSRRSPRSRWPSSTREARRSATGSSPLARRRG